MGLFRRAKPDQDVLDRLTKLEKRWDGIELEWTDWFDRFRRLYAKIAKRAKEVDVADERKKSREDALGDTISSDSDPQYPPQQPSDLVERRRRMRGF